MKETLKDLWYGKIAPSQDLGISNEEIEFELLCVDRQFNQLYSTLDDKAKYELECLEKHYRKSVALQREYAFKQGFVLATKLITESL